MTLFPSLAAVCLASSRGFDPSVEAGVFVDSVPNDSLCPAEWPGEREQLVDALLSEGVPRVIEVTSKVCWAFLEC